MPAIGSIPNIRCSLKNKLFRRFPVKSLARILVNLRVHIQSRMATCHNSQITVHYQSLSHGTEKSLSPTEVPVPSLTSLLKTSQC